MNVTFACPHCQQAGRVEFDTETEAIACPHCHGELRVPDDAWDGDELTRCLVCPSTDLFIRKDFPQRLGVAIVVVGFLASSVAWYYYQVYWSFGILFAVAAIDVALYLVMGESLTCYRCAAEYRGLQGLKRHGGFDLTIHERYRQQAARLARRH
jgi:uncharacterized protein YbaR (Trm112 family)